MDNPKQFEICIIGGGCVDFFFEVNDFPKEGETISTSRFFDAAGGKGVNQAVAVAKVNSSSIFAGQFGKDDAGALIEKQMKEAGVNMNYLRKIDNARTAVGFITLSGCGQNAIINVGGANTYYDDYTKLPDEYARAIDKSGIILLQREISNEINTLAAVYAHSKGKLVVLDVGGRDEPLSEELLGSLDYISLNETELERIVGKSYNTGIEEMIKQQILAKNPRLKVLLKLGEHGSALITKDIFLKCDNVTVYNDEINQDYKVVDATGAGDCWIGTFFVKYAQLRKQLDNKSLSEEEFYKRCMLFGSLCAFLSITKKGCISAMPDSTTVKAFQEKYLPKLQI